jgi:hypothetical protein
LLPPTIYRTKGKWNTCTRLKLNVQAIIQETKGEDRFGVGSVLNGMSLQGLEANMKTLCLDQDGGKRSFTRGEDDRDPAKVKCPACHASIRVYKTLGVGDFTICWKCDEVMEIVSETPLTLGRVFEDPLTVSVHPYQQDLCSIHSCTLVFE